MSSSSTVRRSIRRLKPEQHTVTLLRRDDLSLPFIDVVYHRAKVVLDTTVYIDAFQGRLPLLLERSLRTASVWHSTVTACELTALAGLLGPNHPSSSRTIERVTASVDHRPEHRIVNPDDEIWNEAGILAGLLACLQHYGKAEQRRVLNDALIFLSAAKAGLTVLTRNSADYDLLMQLAPWGRAMFYRV